MRPIYLLGRTCARGRIPPSITQLVVRRFRASTKQSSYSFQHFSNPPKHHGRILLLSAAALSPAAFVQLSEKDNGGTEKTGEGRMLAASRKEIEKHVPDEDTGLTRARHSVVFFLDLYIWEPLCTTFRFFHLAFIFIPVIITVPAMWIGARNPDLDNERSGKLWWFRFLVRAMERAGPAFIKVNNFTSSKVCAC